MNHHGIEIRNETIVELCCRHHIRWLALLGSVLRDDFGVGSDVDVLVEFEPGATSGFGFFGIQDELSHVLERKVDLYTPQCLTKHFRDEVLREAEVLYDAA